MKCDKCDVDMKIGTALWPFENTVARYSYWVVSMGPLLAKLIIPCWKCPECGKSEELSKEEYKTLKGTI